LNYWLSSVLQSAVRALAHELFHEHRHITDEQMKERLKAKLESDPYCAAQLKKSEDMGLSYDKLWDTKLYSAVSNILYNTINIIS
jgi:hypothetical protein